METHISIDRISIARMNSGESEPNIFDLAARIGVQAKYEGVDKSQIENILSSLDLVEDERKSLLVTALFAERQAARLGRGRETARLINNSLTQLYASGKKKNQARQLLGLAKWVYEAASERRLPISPRDIKNLTFEKLLEALRRC